MTTPKLESTRLGDLTDMCSRVSTEPLLTPENATPSDPRLVVIGVLNPAVWISAAGIRLIVRVDERPRDDGRSPHEATIPVARVDLSQGHARLEIVEVDVDAGYLRDSQAVLPRCRERTPGTALLSHVSHLRIAEYDDGAWRVQPRALVDPSDEWTQFGCEDPRVTCVDGEAYLTYAAISRFGATAWRARLDPAGRVVSPRMMLGPDHKHAFLLPGRAQEHYWLFARPLVRSWIRHDGVWAYRSCDLTAWVEPTPVIMPRPSHWDSQRVGPGTILQIPEGWLLLYYGVDASDSYHVGAALLKSSDPTVVLARTDAPILSPTLSWERTGRRADTVFCCGAAVDSTGRSFRLFYGAADTYVGAADVSYTDLCSALLPPQ